MNTDNNKEINHFENDGAQDPINHPHEVTENPANSQNTEARDIETIFQNNGGNSSRGKVEYQLDLSDGRNVILIKSPNDDNIEVQHIASLVGMSLFANADGSFQEQHRYDGCHSNKATSSNVPTQYALNNGANTNLPIIIRQGQDGAACISLYRIKHIPSREDLPSWSLTCPRVSPFDPQPQGAEPVHHVYEGAIASLSHNAGLISQFINICEIAKSMTPNVSDNTMTQCAATAFIAIAATGGASLIALPASLQTIASYSSHFYSAKRQLPENIPAKDGIAAIATFGIVFVTNYIPGAGSILSAYNIYKSVKSALPSGNEPAQQVAAGLGSAALVAGAAYGNMNTLIPEAAVQGMSNLQFGAAISGIVNKSNLEIPIRFVVASLSELANDTVDMFDMLVNILGGDCVYYG